jgi:hypothetical protein
MTMPVTPTTRRRWLSAETVDRLLLPLLAAFVAGFIVAQQCDEVRLAQADAAVARAMLAVQRTQARLDLFASACTPLLSWPIESTPEIVPAPMAQAPAAAPRRGGGRMVTPFLPSTAGSVKWAAWCTADFCGGTLNDMRSRRQWVKSLPKPPVARRH